MNLDPMPQVKRVTRQVAEKIAAYYIGLVPTQPVLPHNVVNMTDEKLEDELNHHAQKAIRNDVQYKIE